METKKKKIGIIGGISAASTMQYYKTITDMYFERYNNYYYPEILIYSLDFQHFTDFENTGQTEEYINYILTAVTTLMNTGVDFIAMAANSPHSVFHEVVKRSGAKMVSIVEATAKAAVRANLNNVLLTGIKHTMCSGFYQDYFNKIGISILVPNEAHQDEINRMIFEELVINKFTNETRRKFIEIINSYDADSVILGCTELPLLLNQQDTDIVLLDTLSLHCAEILDYAMS